MKALIPKLIPVLLASLSLNVIAATTHYVDLNSPSPTPPYTSWLTAATNIQLAVNLSVLGDTVLVTNGVYQTGGINAAGSNRVAVTRPITVSSVNGPSVTVIHGYQSPSTTNGTSALRCVYLTSGATLSGFTLTHGATIDSGSGGGVMCQSTSAVLTNCIITGNSAGYEGGGAYSGTLNNCVLSGNSASASGGGSSSGTLNNCVLSGNSASYSGGGDSSGTLNNCTLVSNSASSSGGGSFGGLLSNCIVYFNSAPLGANSHQSSSIKYSCTTPLPVFGTGNFTNAPSFVDSAGGNFQLQSNSPCINSGRNSSAPAGPDPDSNPRISGGTVDIGAYEFQSPSSLLSYAWAQQNGLPTDGSADFTDADGDGMNNYGEWRSDTSPTNVLSVLGMVTATNSPTGADVTWQSVSTRNYWLERATNLALASPFQTIATNIVGVAGVKSFTDTSATNAGPYFYRVGVQ
jgi:hypothetical protein